MSAADENLSLAMLDWIDRFAPYGVFATDRDLKIRRWNEWMRAHSGLEASAVLGRSITDVFPELEARHLVNHFKRALAGEVSLLSTALHGYLLPFSPISRDSIFKHMRQTARIAPLRSGEDVSGAIVLIEDVTQREAQAEILRQQHARDEILSWALAHLLKSDNPRRASRDLFFKVAEHLDFDTYLLYLRNGDETSFRLTAAGGLTPEAESGIRELSAEQIPTLSELQAGKTLLRDHSQIQADPILSLGKSLGFTAYVVLPLAAQEKLFGFLTFATRSRQEITRTEVDLLTTIAEYLAVALNREKTDRDLRQAQTLLKEHAQSLEGVVAERTASLKQIIAELQTFSYTVAHDLRAPIRALKGYSDVLLEDFSGELSSEAKAIILRLREASIRMDMLTRDLLEFSKVSRQNIELGPVSLEEAIRGFVLSAAEPTRNAISIISPLHDVLGHRTLIDQCVTNLVENGMKFVTPGARPKITIWSEVISGSQKPQHSAGSHFTPSRYSLTEKTKTAGKSDRRVRVWFEDEGIGIPKEAQQKIFGIFERGVTISEYEGTGIGLAIISRAMERMGGHCGVESTPGEGSRFWLEFHPAPTAQ